MYLGKEIFTYEIKYLSAFIGVYGSLIIFFVSMRHGRKRKIQNRIINGKEDILEIEKTIEKCSANYNNDVKNYSLKNFEHQNRIENLRVKIEHCEKYLGLGKNKRKEYLFSERCNEIGILTEIDMEMEEYRSKAMNSI